MSVNRFVCVGNLTRDPEIRELPSGSTVCGLRVAVDGMGRAAEAGFISVSVYGKPGEAAAEYLGKGWLVAVDGRLEYREWETEDGDKRHDHSVVGNVEFLAPPRPAEQEEPPPRPARRRREPVAA
jgi:single-strand DNA-binding protein